MSHLRLPLVLSVLIAALSTCCCPLGGLIGGAEFTTGDFANVPAYPGSTQTTEANAAVSAMTMVFSFVAEEIEWKHYVTTDSESDVLDWYELPDYGWGTASGEDLGNVETEGGLIFSKEDDPEVLLVIFAITGLEEGSSDTHVVVGRIRIADEDY